MMISGTKSSWRVVTSSVPQESLLDPILFDIFITDLGDGAERALCNVAGDTELGGAALMPEGHASFQRDLTG